MIKVALPPLLVERLRVLGLSLDRSTSSIIKQSLEGFLDDLGDLDPVGLVQDLGSSIRQAGRLRLMRQRAGRHGDTG